MDFLPLPASVLLLLPLVSSYQQIRDGGGDEGSGKSSSRERVVARVNRRHGG